jgi:hypothetical protein
MITGPSQHRAISSLGWTDHGSLWTCDAKTSAVTTVPVSDARHLALAAGKDGLFSVVHHFDGSHATVTVHAFEAPAVPLAQLDATAARTQTSGDQATWDLVPSAYVAYLTGASNGYHLIRVTRHDSDVAALTWFTDDDSWDHGYQAVTAVTEIPGTSELLFTVTRCSDLILCDPSGQTIRQRIPLAGAEGDPVPHLSQRSQALWAVDYDTAVRLDRTTWQIITQTRIQDAKGRTRMFAGNLWISPDETTILAPRPGSGDIVALDPRTLAITEHFPVGSQPLVAARLSTGDIIARDWHTGTLLTTANKDH